LTWIESLYPRAIELGLERVHDVLAKMDLRHPGFGVVSVAGTNGKGSTVAMLEACLRAAGYRVGAYTSPHLVRYNERVRLDGRLVTDEELCQAFARTDSARGATPLTYFEFGTVAALEIFSQHKVDIAVLEVGLGGRLDAVNGVEADAAIVTSIGIDHIAWLGRDRETIGREKAGIFRAGRPAVCSDPNPPASVATVAAEVGAKLWQLDRDYFVERSDSGWNWRFGDTIRAGLPYPSVRGDHQLHNAAGALMVVETLSDRYPVNQAAIRQGLFAAVVPGRFQVLPGPPLVVLDVAHNPQASEALAATLRQQTVNGKTLAVFGILKDKDIAGVVRAMKVLVDRWYLGALDAPRSAGTEELAAALNDAGVNGDVSKHPDILSAYTAAVKEAGPTDRIVVFGSFYAVGDILARHTQTG
jgi:dihydrofolate synthase / folylpolyglutamate synthase